MSEAGAASQQSRQQGRVEHARALLQRGRVADAARLAEQAADGDPDDADALYLLAVCLRYLKRPEQARQVLEQLEAVRPGYGRAYQEQGHLARAGGDTSAAVAAFERALAHNPALTASWRALGELHETRGDAAGASRARAYHDRLARMPAELVSVTSFLHEGQLYKAERLCRAFLRRHPHDLEAMRLLAAVGARLHVLDDAEFLLESALEFEPGFLPARVDYVRVLQRRQRFDRALEQARIVCAADPGNASYQALYADACMAAGHYDQALQVYDSLLRAHPGDAPLSVARGHALKTIGRQGEAIDAYRTACVSRPGFGDPYWSLANLKTYRFDDREIETMRAAERSERAAPADRYHLCFALGKALEDRGEFQEAFACYSRGNALKREEVGYRPERLEAEFARQREICRSELFQSRSGLGCRAQDPIFIVGLPRAGSTLLEQVLASHSQVDGTFELPNILALVHRLRGRRPAQDPRYPAVLADLGAAELQRLGQRYLDDTRMHRQGAPFFTDKMPNNFRHLGLIHLILPDARIIDARRHPMACCVSAFKQLFAEGQEFSYSLEDLGRYYRGYVELMDHWQDVLPGRILRVDHEAVVADLEGEVRRILEFLGLPFEPACLEFHKTKRSVRTASSEQVRRPLYDSALEHWRHYELWLGPLRTALGPDCVGRGNYR
jgi:tetratricopeptide (TPR) repeat protein